MGLPISNERIGIRRCLLPIAVLLCLLVSSAQATGTRPNTHQPHCGQATASSTFTAAVWSKERWRRGDPKPSTIEAWHRNAKCAGRTGRREWRQARRAYYEHRSAMLWLEKYKPFIYPDGTRWATPYPIAWCESGGNYFVGPYGAYGLILEPEWLPPRVQDEIAYHLLHTVGEYQAWVRWESGCVYR